MDTSVPTKIYKYRKFDLFSLRILTNGSIYFSDPTHFNDPLDCKPEVFLDIDRDSLQRLCMAMTERSSQILYECELSAAYYYADSKEKESYFLSLLTSKIKDVVQSEFGKRGVLSLAESWSCPLMWSHYGDQHKGVCFGFDTSRAKNLSPKRVDYDGTRCIKCSDLMNCYINKNDAAKELLDHTFFFTKATEWKYEREWRLLSDRPGEESNPYGLCEIYFGMRCDPAIITTILNLTEKLDVDYYLISPKQDTFELIATRFDSELKYSGPQFPDNSLRW